MKIRGLHRRSRAGVTLLELIVAVALVVILSLAVTRAFIAALDAERIFNRRQGQQSPQASIELQITRLLQSAMLSESTTDTTTYFLGEYGNVGTAAQTTSSTASPTGSATSATTPSASSTSASTGGSGSNATSNGTDLGCDRLTFTTTAPDIPLAIVSSTDDFETQQQTYGPVGGVAEVSLSTTAVGDAGDRTGLFERLQRPSDGDATQGGTETLLSDQVKGIGFQFWDGAEWVEAWDSTTTPDTGRLPAAVLVTYTLLGDPTEKPYQFTVALPASNVTIANPITQTTSSPTSTTGGAAGR